MASGYNEAVEETISNGGTMNEDSNFDVGGFLGRALDTGLGYFKPESKPATRTAPKPPPNTGWQKWAVLGGIALAALVAVGLIFRKG